MSDEKLIAMFCSEDERAIIETERKYGRLLYGIARNIVGAQDAEEIVTRSAAGVAARLPRQHSEAKGAEPSQKADGIEKGLLQARTA